MSNLYVSNGFTIAPNNQTIERDGQIISVRPKTFALLLLFLARPQELLSKDYLLNSVWDDVIVAEPVLVQSIRELRQLFGCSDIIQTYPRKGYAWSSEVQTTTVDVALKLGEKSRHFKKSYFIPRFAIIFFIIAAMLITLFSVQIYLKSISSTDVVIVLPVNNEMLDSSYNWVALGAMDQLINTLNANGRTQIMSAEYVLQLMRYAPLLHNGSNVQVSRVFEVSGASLVVETSLSGSVDDYRLSYKLHHKNDIKPGVIFDRNLENALQKMGAIIAESTGVTIASSVSLANNAFHNELMSRALEKMDTNEPQLAANLLLSLKQLEPNNNMARQLLSRILLQLKQFDAAKEEVISALAMADNKDFARIYLLLAEIQFQQGLVGEALRTLDLAGTTAETINDVLYLGYIAQFRANIQQAHGQFSPAITSYEHAIKYFSLIRCPIGTSITQLQMADLFIKQGNINSANAHYVSAKHLINNHKLYRLEALLAKTQAGIH